jgi:tetratricopeptide (TPR) repeat protein
MNRILLAILACSSAIFGGALFISTQTADKVTSTVSAAAMQHLVDLAAQGRCQEALPGLKKSAPRVIDKQLKYRAEMATARCAMSLEQSETTIQALLALNREFPNDPQVLYISTHFYSELGSRAAQRLAAIAPSSPQAHQLQAESMESQEKWDDAASEYKHILEQNPQLPGIHFRLGRIALSRPQTASTAEDAKREFQEELKVDANNAAAEFFLGEIARQAGQWPEAIDRFSSAAKLDPSFLEAYLALGISLNSAERFQDAVAPLETYTKAIPADPAGHYQLSVAFARTGRKQDATRELLIQQELDKKNPDGASRPINGSAPN